MNNIIVKLGLILLLGLVSNASFAERTTTYMHSDALGSVIAASDEDGNLLWRKQYQPFGSQIEGGNESEEVSYTGKKFDKATGLSYYGARYYDPHMGRFTSVDPVGVLGSVESNPMMFNRYAYANNNPYKYVDPDGKFPFLVFAFAAIGTYFTADGAIDAYNNNSSVLDEGISRSGAKAAAKSLAIDGTITVATGGTVGFLAKPLLKNTAKTVDPNTIRFTQDSVGNTIGTPNGDRPLRKLVKDLTGGRTFADDIPAIRVFNKDGNLTTLDNRRLKAFQVANQPINTVPATAEEVASEAYKFTSKNAGTSVKVRNGGL